jgi:hypothetical protein
MSEFGWRFFFVWESLIIYVVDKCECSFRDKYGIKLFQYKFRQREELILGSFVQRCAYLCASYICTCPCSIILPTERSHNL